MSSSFKISNINDTVSFERLNLNDEQIKEINKFCQKGRQKFVPILDATFMPVRTNNWKNFSIDFFLPTVVNHAIKTKSVVGKIFAILAALPLDIVTFVSRLIFCIPKVIYNAIKEEHPLRKYISKETGTTPEGKELLNLDYVKVHINTDPNGKGRNAQKYPREQFTRFVTMPYVEEIDS